MGIRVSRRVGRYFDFMSKNLDAVDEELERSGRSNRLAQAVRNERFPERKKPEFVPKEWSNIDYSLSIINKIKILTTIKAFNYLNQGDFDERMWPQDQFSAADEGFVRSTKDAFMLIGLVVECAIDVQKDLACFSLRVAGTYCLTIDFKGSIKMLYMSHVTRKMSHVTCTISYECMNRNKYFSMFQYLF